MLRYYKCQGDGILSALLRQMMMFFFLSRTAFFFLCRPFLIKKDAKEIIASFRVGREVVIPRDCLPHWHLPSLPAHRRRELHCAPRPQSSFRFLKWKEEEEEDDMKTGFVAIAEIMFTTDSKRSKLTIGKEIKGGGIVIEFFLSFFFPEKEMKERNKKSFTNLFFFSVCLLSILRRQRCNSISITPTLPTINITRALFLSLFIHI